MGVALTSCSVPAAGRPTFAIGDDEMETGVGIHGEPGRRRVKLATADAIAAEMLQTRGLKVSRYLTGSLVTSLDMCGCSITLSVLDDATRALWDAPVYTAALRWGM